MKGYLHSTGMSHAAESLPLACFLLLAGLTAQNHNWFNVIYAAVQTDY